MDDRNFDENAAKDGTLSKDVLFLHSLDEILRSLREAGLNVKETSTFCTVISIRG